MGFTRWVKGVAAAGAVGAAICAVALVPSAAGQEVSTLTLEPARGPVGTEVGVTGAHTCTDEATVAFHYSTPELQTGGTLPEGDVIARLDPGDALDETFTIPDPTLTDNLFTITCADGTQVAATAFALMEAHPALCSGYADRSQCVDVRFDPPGGPVGTQVRLEADATGCDTGTPPGAELWVYPDGGGLDAAGNYFEAYGEGTKLGDLAGGEVLRTTWNVDEGTTPAFWLTCKGFFRTGNFENFEVIEGAATSVGTDDAGGSGTDQADDDDDEDQAAASAPGGPHTRSSVTQSVPAPGDVSTDGGLALTNLAIAALMILLVFPAELFNATLEEHYDDVTAWLRAPRRLLARASQVTNGSGGLVGFVVVTAATAVLYAFLDPNVAFDKATIALVIGIGLSIAVGVLAGGWAARRYAAGHDGGTGSLRVYPAALLVAAVCVLISRLADFQPGYLYGIVAGFVFTAELSRRHDGRSTAFAASIGLAVSIAAWFAWVPIRDLADDADPNVVVLVFDALLATMFVGGLQALVFGFVPIRYLPGAKVWAWSKPVWALLFGMGTFGFVHVLLHPAEGYEGSLTTMVVLFVAFAIASVAFWAYWRSRTSNKDVGLTP